MANTKDTSMCVIVYPRALAPYLYEEQLATKDGIPHQHHSPLWLTLLNISDNARRLISLTPHKHTQTLHTWERKVQGKPTLDENRTHLLILHTLFTQEDLQETVFKSQKNTIKSTNFCNTRQPITLANVCKMCSVSGFLTH